MSPAHHVGRLRLELVLQRPQKGIEKIQKKAGAAADHIAHVFLHQGAEYDRPHALVLADQIDFANRLYRLVNGGDKWHSHLPKFNTVELCHEAVAHRLCGDPCLVRNKKHSSFSHGSPIWRLLRPEAFHLTNRRTSN